MTKNIKSSGRRRDSCSVGDGCVGGGVQCILQIIVLTENGMQIKLCQRLENLLNIRVADGGILAEGQIN
jgi:hypothetical protein